MARVDARDLMVRPKPYEGERQLKRQATPVIEAECQCRERVLLGRGEMCVTCGAYHRRAPIDRETWYDRHGLVMALVALLTALLLSWLATPAK